MFVELGRYGDCLGVEGERKSKTQINRAFIVRKNDPCPKRRKEEGKGNLRIYNPALGFRGNKSQSILGWILGFE